MKSYNTYYPCASCGAQLYDEEADCYQCGVKNRLRMFRLAIGDLKLFLHALGVEPGLTKKRLEVAGDKEDGLQ